MQSSLLFAQCSKDIKPLKYRHFRHLSDNIQFQEFIPSVLCHLVCWQEKIQLVKKISHQQICKCSSLADGLTRVISGKHVS